VSGTLLGVGSTTVNKIKLVSVPERISENIWSRLAVLGEILLELVTVKLASEAWKISRR